MSFTHTEKERGTDFYCLCCFQQFVSRGERIKPEKKKTEDRTEEEEEEERI